MFDRVSHLCARVAESRRFQLLVIGLILNNAVVLGLETVDSIEREHGALLDTLNDVFLAAFTLEIAIRILAHGRRPLDYFRDGWNVFDFVIIFAAFLPFLRQNATLLRVVRLLRVFRLLSILPELRVITLALVRSVAPIAGMGLMVLLLIYVYGMVGWLLYDDDHPEYFGNIGVAMLTLFKVLTLEGWPDIYDEIAAVNDWAFVYFISFVLISSFVLFNMLIGIVINSLEESRAIEMRRIESEVARAEGRSRDQDLMLRLSAIRASIDELERELIRDAAVDGRAGVDPGALPPPVRAPRPAPEEA